MLNHPCQVLLVEDNASDGLLFEQLLNRSQSALFPHSFGFTRVSTLSDAIAHVAQHDVDVLFLDLVLPESRGIDTLIEARRAISEVPIVVYTTLEDEAIAVQSFQYGACGYVSKLLMDSNLIVYAIRMAIERHQKLKIQSERLSGLDTLDQIASRRNYDIEAEISRPLSEQNDIFLELMQSYDALIEKTLKDRIYRVDRPAEADTTRAIQVLANRLGYLQASPRDVMNLHTNVLRTKTNTLSEQDARAYIYESSFLILELMGDLSSYYRRYFVGLNKLNLTQEN